MLRGLIKISEALTEDFDMIKQFCDKNDVQIYRLNYVNCVVFAKPKKMYKLMKFVSRHGRKIINIDLVD